MGGARCSRAVHSEHCKERKNEVACVKMALAPARTRRNGGPGLAPRHQCSSRGYLSLATMVTPWRYSDAVPWGPSDTHAAGMLHQTRIWRMPHALVPFRDDADCFISKRSRANRRAASDRGMLDRHLAHHPRRMA